MDTLKLQIGNRYLTRNGLETTPLRLSNNGTNYKYEAEITEPGSNKPTIASWREDGYFIHSDTPGRLDLIELLK